MFVNLPEILPATRLPFEENTPRIFPGAFELGGISFDPRVLMEDDEFRCGMFGPNDRKVNLVRDQQIVPRDEYATADKAWSLWRGGASVVFYGLQRYHEGVSALCQLVANALALPVHVNAYWTPPGNQGFPLHADPDSVIVVQMAGSKSWPIFPPKAASLDDVDALSWVHAEGRTREIAPPEKAAFVMDLRPGHVMWLPRGWGHYAVAGGEESFHISLGILHPEIGARKVAGLHPVYPVN